MKIVKFLIAKSLKLGHRYLISIICMLLLGCRIFSANNYSIVIEEVFLGIKSRIVNKAIKKSKTIFNIGIYSVA